MRELLERLSEEYHFHHVFLSKADVLGFIYFYWSYRCDRAKLSIRKLHLDACLFERPDARFDFVIGEVKDRQIVRSELIIEVEFFDPRLSEQKLGEHYLRVIRETIPKLASIQQPKYERYLLLFDEGEFLQGLDSQSKMKRIDKICDVREKADPFIVIIYTEKREEDLIFQMGPYQIVEKSVT
jgi:hypothetical protein